MFVDGIVKVEGMKVNLYLIEDVKVIFCKVWLDLCVMKFIVE